MKTYEKPQVEIVDFRTESIMEVAGDGPDYSDGTENI